MSAKALAISNDPIADEAASEFIASGGSATGAVLCGFFAAAGAHSGVLVGPVSILVAGVGRGARAFDGRLRQPGLGTKRPRGFKAGEAVPDQARLAVPTSVPAALVALAYDGSQSLTTILKPGITRAQRAGAGARAALLRQVRSQGAAAFSDTAFVRPLLRVAGPSQGGLLTSADFGQVGGLDHEASSRTVDGTAWLEAPWASEPGEVDTAAVGIGIAVCAVDVRGHFAALCYRRLVDGFPIDDLELEAPLAAQPVLRGVERAAPGAPLPSPAPIAFATDASGAVTQVIASPALAVLDAGALQSPALALRRSAGKKTVEAARA